MDDKIVFEGSGIALRQLPDVLFLDLPGREQGMLALGPIIPAHAFQRLFSAVNFPADVERIEIDGDRVIEKRERGQRPEKAAPSALRAALENDKIMKVSVREEPEVPPGLNALVPAVLVDGFLRFELADRVVVLPLEIGGIQEGREIPEQILRGHGRDLAAVRLEERGNHAPVLVEGFVELMQNSPAMIGKESLVCARGRIRGDPLREKEDELLTAKPARLHHLPVAANRSFRVIAAHEPGWQRSSVILL